MRGVQKCIQLTDESLIDANKEVEVKDISLTAKRVKELPTSHAIFELICETKEMGLKMPVYKNILFLFLLCDKNPHYF